MKKEAVNVLFWASAPMGAVSLGLMYQESYSVRRRYFHRKRKREK